MSILICRLPYILALWIFFFRIWPNARLYFHCFTGMNEGTNERLERKSHFDSFFTFSFTIAGDDSVQRWAVVAVFDGHQRICSPSRNTKIIENKILLQNIFSFVFFFSWIQKFLSAVRQFQERKESEKSNASNTNSERKKIVRMHSWVPSKDHRKGYLFYFWPRTVSVNPTPNLSAFDLNAVVKREILHHVSTKLCAGRVRDSPDDWRRRNVKFYEIQTPFVGGSTGRARFSTNSRGAISFFRRLSFIQRLHQISFFFEFNLNYECGA